MGFILGGVLGYSLGVGYSLRVGYCLGVGFAVPLTWLAVTTCGMDATARALAIDNENTTIEATMDTVAVA